MTQARAPAKDVLLEATVTMGHLLTQLIVLHITTA